MVLCHTTPHELQSNVICHYKQRVNAVYLLGGTLGKQVLSVFLPALTQAGNSPAQWRMLPDAPLKYSAAVAFHRSLLAVGGCHDEQCSSAIHVYDQEKKAWKKVEDLPTE